MGTLNEGTDQEKYESPGKERGKGDGRFLPGLLRNKFAKLLMMAGVLALPLSGCSGNNGNNGRRQSRSPQRTEEGVASETNSLRSQLASCLAEKDVVGTNLSEAQIDLAQAKRQLEIADATQEISADVNAVFTEIADLKYVPNLLALLQVILRDEDLIGLAMNTELGYPFGSEPQTRDTLLQVIGSNPDIQVLVSKFANVIQNLPSELRSSIIQRMIADLPGFQEVLERYEDFKTHMAHAGDVDIQLVYSQNSEEEGVYKFVIKEGKPSNACLDLGVHDDFDDKLNHDTKAFFRLLVAAEKQGMSLEIFRTAIAEVQKVFGLDGVRVQ